MSENTPLWVPSEAQVALSPMTKFREFCAVRNAIDLPDHDAFHQWSIDERGAFWSAVWDFCGVRGEKGARELIHGDVMLDARFFPDATLNFAENLLAKHGPEDALIFRGEDKVGYRWSWDQLHSTVSKLPSRIKNISGTRWFVTFVDDHTRVTWVFLMKEKSEVGHIFQTFNLMVS